MRALLVLVLLVAVVPGCCCGPAAPCAPAGRPSLYGPDCRPPYTPGYRRPCYPAYRPIDSADSP